MKIYLIRHAETVHNVGQAWAGTTDSALTNHGAGQIRRLAASFRAASVIFEHVFASDLSRAVLTAEGICDQCVPADRRPIFTPYLREQHFGSREGLRIHGSVKTTTSIEDEPAESEGSMRTRANRFLDEYLFPVLWSHEQDRIEMDSIHVAIVAHGIILRVLWSCLARSFPLGSVTYAPEVAALAALRGGVLVPSWSNTGYMELSISPRPASESSHTSVGTGSPLSGWSIKVLAVDNKMHLRNLQRTRGGIGSSQHDTTQRSIESFFKR